MATACLLVTKQLRPIYTARVCLGVALHVVHVVVQPEHSSRSGGDGCTDEPLG